MPRRKGRQRNEADRAKHRTAIGGGKSCPNGCGQMTRCRHPDGWKPKHGAKCYFSEWDHCLRCTHVQHYEQFRVWVRPARVTDLGDGRDLVALLESTKP